MHFQLSRYWTFQILGWGLFGLINLFFAILFGQFQPAMLCRLLFFLEMGILSSHFMRHIIRKNSLLMRPINQQIILLLILTLVFASFFSLAQTPFEAAYSLYPTGKPAPFHIHFSSIYLAILPLHWYFLFSWFFILKYKQLYYK